MQVTDIRNLIGKGRTDKALKGLYEWAAKHDNEVLNNIMLLQSRLNRVERQANMGLISSSEVNMERNRITYSLLSTLNDLEEDPNFQSAVTQDQVKAVPLVPNTGQQQATAGKKLFISYARDDRAFVEELELHLAPLVRGGLVSTWSDSAIRPGQQWNKEIKDNLVSADIILFIVSANFLASEYINDNEREWARVAKANRNAQIVPVIARPCLWQSDVELADYQAVPTDNGSLVPITRWNNRDDAFLAIVEQLSTIIQS